MNILLKFIFIRKNLLNQTKDGFTLIELLVVVIIVGVLAAVALPNLMGQIGKARETEAKISLGTLARAQQAYHFETKSFYKGSDISNFSEISLAKQYYAYTGDSDTTADANKVIHTAYAIDPKNSGARDFSVGVFFDAPSYRQIMCGASGIDEDGTTSSVSAQADGTCVGGYKIK